MIVRMPAQSARMVARCILLVSLTASFGACSSSEQLTSLENTGSPPPATAVASKPPGAIKPATQQSSREVARIFDEYSVPDGDGEGADYRMAPMDVVEVAVYDAPNLSRTTQVSASGYITLPLIKDVRAAGKTTDQLQTEISARLQKDFMQSPQVFVNVKEFNSQRVTVDGAVKTPGVYPLKGETSLLQVLAMSGGLSEMASSSGIYVLRKEKGKKMAARFDLAEIRKGKVDDPQMRAGDIVIVDESGGKVALRGLREAMGFSGLFTMLLL